MIRYRSCGEPDVPKQRVPTKTVAAVVIDTPVQIALEPGTGSARQQKQQPTDELVPIIEPLTLSVTDDAPRDLALGLL